MPMATTNDFDISDAFVNTITTSSSGVMHIPNGSSQAGGRMSAQHLKWSNSPPSVNVDRAPDGSEQLIQLSLHGQRPRVSTTHSRSKW